MAEVKRKNFSKDEKEKLISIILKYKNIIENKKSDSSTLGEKEKCWKDISEEFNSCSSTARTTTQLKAFYKNAKCDIKKKIAANKASIFRTGGGQQQCHLDENDPLLAVVTAQTFSVENPYDSSCELFVAGTIQEATDEVIQVTVPEVDEALPQMQQNSRKRQRTKKPSPFEEERQNLFKELVELKRQKIASDIEKNRVKTEMYKTKIEILEKYKNNNQY